MDQDDPLKRETDSLIEAIWGPDRIAPAEPVDPKVRAEQNRALAAAMRAYLQQYLRDS